MTVRHDRYGELITTEADDTTDLGPPAGAHRCDNGWIDRDNAVPCLRCRPHLKRHTHTPQPTADNPKARAAAVRSALQTARNAGLKRRHATKLEHLRARTSTIPEQTLIDALSAARCPTCHQPAALELGLDTAARVIWKAVATHADDCYGTRDPSEKATHGIGDVELSPDAS